MPTDPQAFEAFWAATARRRAVTIPSRTLVQDRPGVTRRSAIDLLGSRAEEGRDGPGNEERGSTLEAATRRHRARGGGVGRGCGSGARDRLQGVPGRAGSVRLRQDPGLPGGHPEPDDARLVLPREGDDRRRRHDHVLERDVPLRRVRAQAAGVLPAGSGEGQVRGARTTRRTTRSTSSAWRR